MKTIAELMEQMIVFSNGNLHDITHFITVWTYARTIGELEGLDADTQYLLGKPFFRRVLFLIL